MAVDDTALETDPRFPSGEWRGFWMQRSLYGNGRQRMDLVLTFKNGRVTGEGRDMLDDFVVTGRYDVTSGEVTWHKKHLALGYSVYYRGFAEGTGKDGIWGLWHLPTDRDGFHIWPRGVGESEGEALEAEVDVPMAVGG